MPAAASPVRGVTYSTSIVPTYLLLRPDPASCIIYLSIIASSAHILTNWGLRIGEETGRSRPVPLPTQPLLLLPPTLLSRYLLLQPTVHVPTG